MWRSSFSACSRHKPMALLFNCNHRHFSSTATPSMRMDWPVIEETGRSSGSKKVEMFFETSRGEGARIEGVSCGTFRWQPIVRYDGSKKCLLSVNRSFGPPIAFTRHPTSRACSSTPGRGIYSPSMASWSLVITALGEEPFLSAVHRTRLTFL